MEFESHDHGVDKSSRIREENKVTEAADKKPNDDVLVAINDGNGGARDSESSKAEKLCRICHFSDDESSGESQLIALGCDCKGELGVSHLSCAVAWFSRKGNGYVFVFVSILSHGWWLWAIA